MECNNVINEFYRGIAMGKVRMSAGPNSMTHFSPNEPSDLLSQNEKTSECAVFT